MPIGRAFILYDISTNKKAPVGLGAHGFLGEWPAGNSPVNRGGGIELRAGCASLHRSKWREGAESANLPLNDFLRQPTKKGAVSPVAVKVRDRGMASGLSRDEWPDGTGGGSQELDGGSLVVAVKRSAAFNSDMLKGETLEAAALIESRTENRRAPASFRRAA